MKRNHLILVGVLLVALVVIYLIFSESSPETESSPDKVTETVTSEPESPVEAETDEEEETVSDGVMTDEEIQAAVAEGKPIFVELSLALAMHEEASDLEEFNEEFHGVTYQGTLSLKDKAGTYDASTDQMTYRYLGEMKPVK